MRRLLTLLLMLTLSVTNGAAVTAALCEHVDAEAHAAALVSSDRIVAADAHREDTAAAAADREGALVDAAAVQLAGFLQPAVPSLGVPAAGGMPPRPGRDSPLSHRDTEPLLNPPLA